LLKKGLTPTAKLKNEIHPCETRALRLLQCAGKDWVKAWEKVGIEDCWLTPSQLILKQLLSPKPKEN
jgi:hypothetical protein